jgi:organic radical activating enzyme
MLSKEIQLEVKGRASIGGVLHNSRGGFHTGTAAAFLRIGGCDVCHWCDVKESWNALHPPTSVDLVVANASKYAETVVVTGGH